jgi:CDP-4-dehydro-6-deoxyglucose reductase, E3
VKARLLESREIAPEVRHFVFDVPSTERLDYTPGQFLSLVADVDGQEITRAYSVASPPNGNQFELCLNRVLEGTFSPYLFDLKPGAEVDFKGPYGTFTLRQPGGDALFIATGTGIAPVRGMLADLLPRDSDHGFTLLFGVRYEYGILYREEFERLAAGHPNFHFRPTLSRAGEAWKGLAGHVQTHLEGALGELESPHVYICGLKAMVDDVRAILKGKGLDRRRIVYEKYD